MSKPIEPALKAFLVKFFGPGNALQWNKIERGTLPPEAKAKFAPWLDAIQNNTDPLILPKASTTMPVEWYFISQTEPSARALREYLSSFLGPTHSDFDGRPSQFSLSDPVDIAVQEFAPRRAFRVRVPDPDLYDAVREKLLAFLELLGQRPSQTGAVPRAYGRILRDFELALLTRNSSAAALCIEELRRDGRISAQNRLFLEVLRRESISDWKGILELPELDELLHISKPRRVIQALIRAVYHTELFAFEVAGNPKVASEHFQKKVWPRFAGLFVTRTGMNSPEVAKSFLLLASASPERQELAKEVLESFSPAGSEFEYAKSIYDLIPTKPRPLAPQTPLSAAQDAYNRGDADLAFKVGLLAPASQSKLALLLRCARELNTLQVAGVVLELIESSTSELRGALLSTGAMKALYEHLLELATKPSEEGNTPPQVPSDWLEWVDALDRLPTTAAVSIAEHGAREWLLDSMLAKPELLTNFANKLCDGVSASKTAESFRQSLPFLLAFFLQPEKPQRDLMIVYEGLAMVIVADEIATEDLLQAFTSLAEARIQLGLTIEQYQTVLDDLSEVWRRVGSGGLIDWSVDVLDMLAALPCPNPDTRSGFVYQVADYIRQHKNRASQAQVELFRSLCNELGAQFPDDLVISEDPEQASSGGELEKLTGKTIALYSLRESAIRRVAELVKSICPTTKVHCFHDLAGGAPALKQQANSADIFVVATASAKHAATDFIKAHRAPTAATVYPAGQGSASILRALRGYLEKV